MVIAPACCSFCTQTEPKIRIVASTRNAWICDECVQLCNNILDAEPEAAYQRVSRELDRIQAYGAEPQPYSVVAPLAGYRSPRDQDLFHQLGRALREDHAANRPLRSTLVINKKLGMPGAAYFKVCRELGYDIPAGKEAEFWNEQLRRLAA